MRGKCSRPERERQINSCTRRARQDTAACVYADPRRFLIGSLLRAFPFRCAWSQGSSAAKHEGGRQIAPDNPALHGTKIELEQSRNIELVQLWVSQLQAMQILILRENAVFLQATADFGQKRVPLPV